jgi:hypothetical protein
VTDQRTLKRIIGEQRGTIEKQKLVIDELNENYLKLDAAYDEAAQTANTYCLKIIEANKILDGPIYGPNNTCIDLVKHLKECLAINCVDKKVDQK